MLVYDSALFVNLELIGGERKSVVSVELAHF